MNRGRTMATISFEAQSYLKRYQQLVLPTVTLILVVGLTMLVLVPQILKGWEDWKSLGELKSRLGRLTEKATVLANLDTAELQVRAEEMRVDVPEDEDLGYFVGSVGSVVRRAEAVMGGVELVGSAEVEATPSGVAKAQPSKGEKFIPLEVAVDGDMSGLRQLLTEINNSVPLMELVDFAFSRGLGDEGFGGSITLRFFYSPKPVTIGASEKPVVVISAAEEGIYEKIAGFNEPETTTLPLVETGNEEFIR